MSRPLTLARLRLRAGQFRAAESGAAAVSYVVMLPVVFGLFLLTLDSGFTAMRSALLDRAVDITARSIRSGTIKTVNADPLLVTISPTPTIAEIKADLCSRLKFFKDCDTQLKVQLVAVSRSDFATPARTIACTDQGTSLVPVRAFVADQTNPLAVLRACMDVRTFTPEALISNRPFTYSIHAETVLAARPS